MEIKSQHWRNKNQMPGHWRVVAPSFYEKSRITKTVSTGKSVILEFQLSGICVQGTRQWEESTRTLKKGICNKVRLS